MTMKIEFYFAMLVCFGCFSAVCASAWGEEPTADANRGLASKSRKIVGFSVFPSSIEISDKRDRHRVIAQVRYGDGITDDVTDQLEYSIADSKVVERVGNEFCGVRDGETTVEARFGGFSQAISIKVIGASLDPKVDFANEIVPILSKVGCNAGSCHGAARGKDGFQLSLYGFDPEGDYFRLTRELPGRRVDLSNPEECLLLSKATGDVAHTGGGLIKQDSKPYRTVLRWLKEGAVKAKGDVPSVDRIELYPQTGLLNGPGTTQQLNVRAFYSDGSDKDVTDLAYFLSNNDNSASVNQAGMVSANKRGEAFISARFDTHTVGSSFVVLPKDLEFEWRDEPQSSYIDARINDKLRSLRIRPSDLCTDAEFIRRVSIDICGIVPTAQAVTEFAGSENPDKRALLVDRLLERKEFVDLWVMKWSELLQIRSLNNRVSYKAALLYYTWLQERIANDVPIDEMIKELLSSEGGTFTSPATNYYQNEQNNLKVAENVAQVFMGIRIQCAQCHNHPFDRWTMEDYYSFAAFFTQLGRKQSDDPREMIIFNRGRGESKHPVTKQNMPPKFLGGAMPETKGKDRRVVLAQWLASPDNPYFATNLANIVWAHFFGRGIVHEVDDVRISNPAVNQPLLDDLGNKLTEYKYDFKKLVRDICNSRTYQRSTITNETNETDLTNFSHATLRRIRAEVLLDVISQITETKNKFRGLPLGARAVQIADGNTSTYFLSTFGRAKRETVCSCEVKAEPNLSQALHLLNGTTVNNKIRSGKVVQKMLDQEMSPKEIINEVFMRSLARKPTSTELDALLAQVQSQKNKKAALEDIFWAVLNSREFVFNH